MVIALLGAITYQDIKTREIPDGLNLLFFLLGVARMVLVSGQTLPNRLIGSAIISLPLLLASVITAGSIGGGDVKLMAAAGFLLGAKEVCLAAAIGIVVAAIYAGWLLVAKKATLNDNLPLGPSLCLGIALSYFCFENILRLLF